MKIAVVGNYSHPQYQQALCEGFEACDCTVVKIILPYNKIWNFYKHFVNSFTLCRNIMTQKPDVVFLYRVESLIPWVIPILKKRTKCIFIAYHNDDPYRTERKNRLQCSLFLRSLKYCDITYVYRTVNINEAYSCGAKNVKLLMSHYYSKYDKKENALFDIYKKTPRIVFVGHFENDMRVEYIDYLYNNDIDLHIYGNEEWRNVFLSKGWPLTHLHPPIYGNEYREIIKTSYMALCFFSTMNRDEYTRRCFEIPMAGTILVAPETTFMKNIFTSTNVVLLYKNKEDLLLKVNNLLSDKELASKISLNGYNYISSGDYSEISRARQILNDIKNIYI